MELEQILYIRVSEANWIFLIDFMLVLTHIRRLYLATRAIKVFQKLKVSKARVIQKRFKDHMLKTKGHNNSYLVECSMGFLAFFLF